ncbi:hypothetical protein [Brevundimonas sp.]|uniref:hypothetical protein n=1 Tax=Brevundimonas sp. TaxID=1871086 RepID=UPI002D246477|nr:hypothetical protein [Brevundimonas sp.]HYC67578.1 hypothetical protein [Brevundimonas sp.]
MFNRKIFALLLGACAVFLIADPAQAQGRGGSFSSAGDGKYAPNVPPGNAVDPPEGMAITRDNTSGSRLNRQTNEERRQAERRRRAARGEAVAPENSTPAQNLRAAQALATGAALECRVTEASLLGVDAQEAPIYEAACAEGPGQLIIASTPTQAYSCFELAAVPEGQQCELPANQNSLAVIGGWARQSGVTCQINQAVAVGRSADGNLIYEIGCAGADGYWLERASDGWRVQSCEVIASTGETCRFSEDRG